MHLKGKGFDGSTALHRTDRDLRTIACNVPLFQEFLPRFVLIRVIMVVLLNILYRHRICCHLSESFVNYIALLFNKHGTICLYVGKHEAPLLNIVLQGGGIADFIDLEGFHFELVRPDYVWDTVKYTLSFGEFSAQLTVIGIGSVPCSAESTVDVVQFVWDNVEQFSCTRYSITLLPHTAILTFVHGHSTSLITGVGATVGIIGMVALCADPTT